jgi:hypothetical protein
MRRMFENQRDLIRRLEKLESDNQRLYPGGGLGGGNVPLGPYYPPTTIGPNTGTWPPPNTGTIPPFPPGTIWGQNNSTLNTGYQAVPPLTATQVDGLLKDEKYKGSSLGTVDVKTA